MEERVILFQDPKEQAVARIRLNYPQKLNALDPEMLGLLEDALAEIEASAEYRVLVLDAAGERAFCAGADIRAWRKLEPAGMWRYWTRLGHRVFGLLEQLRVPSIAAVDGIAFGGGFELALACDLIVCTATAKFAFPEVGLGTVPGWNGSPAGAYRRGAGAVHDVHRRSGDGRAGGAVGACQRGGSGPRRARRAGEGASPTHRRKCPAERAGGEAAATGGRTRLAAAGR